MVNIECTRCGATGMDYPTIYVAKFSLKHETGCGAKIGIPKYSEGKSIPKEDIGEVTKIHEPNVEVITKPKKKKAKKVKQTIIQDLSAQSP